MSASSPWAPSQSAAAWQPPSTGVPGQQQQQQQKPPTKLHLHISCSGLRNMERAHLGKSDPMAVLLVPRPDRVDEWIVTGHTEVVMNDLNPRFVKGFDVDYIFSTIQPLRFEVYDVPHPHHKTDLSRQHLIGLADIRLSELVTAPGKTLTKSLIHPRHTDRKNGHISISAEELRADLGTTIPYDPRMKYVFSEKQSLCVALSGKDLQGHALIGKGDPFFVVNSRPDDKSPWTPVYKSAAAKSTHNPYWDAFTISLQRLNSGDPQRPIRIEVYDHKITGNHEFVGVCEITAAAITPGATFQLVNPNTQGNKRHKNPGEIVVRDARPVVEKKQILNPYYLYSPHSFLDFLAGGLKLHLMVAIDFTASNGAHSSPSSLHYFNPNRSILNEYEQAILSVGKILSDYDHDQRIPVFGFGGHPIAGNVVSHCFPLNRNPSDPTVHGLNGVLDVYHDSFNYFKLSGPTHFADVIREAAKVARINFSPQNQNYQILLIITDGEINDMAETTREIVQASELPLTIVIVGVGSANFENMCVLESDGDPLSWNGKEETRDIVEFVPFERFRGDPQQLATRTLLKLPGDVTTYMALQGIAPGVPQAYVPPPMSSAGAPQFYPSSGGASYPPSTGPSSSWAGTQSPQGPPVGAQPPYSPMMQPGPQGMPQPGQTPAGLPPQYQQQGGAFPGQQPGQPAQGTPYPSQGVPPQGGAFPGQQPGQPGAAYTPLGGPGQQQFPPQPGGPVPGQQMSPQPAYPGQPTTAAPSQQPPQPGPAPPVSVQNGDPQLVELLTRLGYLNLLDKFTSEHLTYEALKEFSKEDMQELGLPAGPRIAIYNALHRGA